MKADILEIEKIFEERKSYFIPSYQRPYKWDPENAEQLVKDIYDSYESEEKDQEYFIGSIICIKKNSDNHNDKYEYEVVDGQQRLITLTIIIKELEYIIENKDIKAVLKKKLLRSDPLSENSTSTPVLQVRKPDHDFYLNRILKGDEKTKNKTDTEKVFLNNKEKIRECLPNIEQEKLKKFINYLLRKVFVVFVEVDDRASSFRLFNVLNARGMPLSDSDLLKNTLLENVSNDEDKSRSVEDNWQYIEDAVGEKNIDRFFAMHLNSEKEDRNRVRKNIFDYYEIKLKDNFNNNAAQMSEIFYRSSGNYAKILYEDLGVKDTISFLGNFSKQDEWLPAFMAFLNKIEDPEDEKFQKFVILFEKIYMQGWLRNLPKSQREGVRYSAVEAINNNKSFDEIMNCLRELSNTKEFETSLDSKDFYNGSRPQIINLVKLVLMRIDAARHDNNVKKTYTGRISVEHILPQKINNESYWYERFTEDDHKEWLHKLGNLTLISNWKNSAARNFDFEKKKEAYKKFNLKCSFDITKDVCDLHEWNMDELKKRHEKLKEEIKALWVVE